MFGTALAISISEDARRPKMRQGWIEMDFSKNGECTALVPVERPADVSRSYSSAARPEASFVVHLIAVASSTPQTRLLRRASQADALNGYNFAATRQTALSFQSGTRLSRVA